MITGAEKPDEGDFRIGETAKIAYVDQGRELDGEKTIVDVVTGGTELLKLGGRDINGRAYIAKFNFSGEDQKKKVSELSGGERNRVHLAAMLKEEGNVLLLDEPTNDLDVNTLRALENAYPNDKCKLSRKHCKVTRMYSSRESDGQLSGTWYAGHKQDVVISARIYDKSLELLNKKFLATKEPITRLELTASKSVGCTLRDAVICDPLFYKLASPAFVSVPPGIPDWEPFGDYCNWVSDPSVPALPIEIIRKKFEFSPDISRIVDLVAPLGEEGISMALRMFEKRLRSIV